MMRRNFVFALVVCAAALLCGDAPGQGVDEPRTSAGGPALANGPVQLFLQEAAEGEERSNESSTPGTESDQPAAGIQQAPREPVPLPKQESQPLGRAPVGEREVERSEVRLPGGQKSAPSTALAADFTLTDVARVLGALGAVLGLAWTIRSIMRRTHGFGPAAPRPSGVVEILARYPVSCGAGGGRGQEIVLIKVARRIIIAHAARGSAGPAMTVLSEITEPDEVAGLLSRMESGAAPKHAGRFRDALRTFQAEPVTEVRGQTSGGSEVRGRKSSTNVVRAPHPIREADRLIGDSDRTPEIVDLTRGGRRGLFAWLGGRSGT